jgi:hypothetical protein
MCTSLSAQERIIFQVLASNASHASIAAPPFHRRDLPHHLGTAARIVDNGPRVRER